MTAGRILLVDDDDQLRASIAQILVREGYTVEHASDGAAALVSIAANPPDAILLDILMPNVNGRQVLEALGSKAATRRIPVLVMTGLSGIEINRTMTAGAADIVEKPFDQDELLGKIALAIYRTEHGGAKVEHQPFGRNSDR